VKERDMTLQESFVSYYPREEVAGDLHCPYRVCPLGAHVDHQWGCVTGFAIDRGVTLRYAPLAEPVVRLRSLDFDGEASFRVEQPLRRIMDWSDYARAAAGALMASGHGLRHGFAGVIGGTLPIGGLSSSASVVIAYTMALCRVNGIAISKAEMIASVLWAENRFIGLGVGKLDPSCEIHCKKDHLLFLDTKDDHVEQIVRRRDAPDFRIIVFFSGVPRALVGTAYNARVDECKAAAYALKAYAGLPYGRFDDTRLRDVPKEIFDAYKNRLPDGWRKRATHFYTEMERVLNGTDAWRRGDIHAFGQAVFDSGNSSIRLYDTGSPELRALHEIMLETPGIYGGRFSGAGFRGCCMAVADPCMADQICDTVAGRYLDRFPQMRGSFSAHVCETADGAAL